jgi:beta-galactosidase
MRPARIAAFLLALFAAAPALADRAVRPLNDGWQFFRADIVRFDESTNWTPVTLPHTWNATDAETGSGWYAGIGWYQKDLGTMDDAKGRRVVLRFEGAGSIAEVFVNGTRVGEHRGSYGAFAFDVTDSIAVGKPNVLRVKVDNRARPDVIPVNDYLFTIFGGIYRPATLILQDPVHVTACDHASSGVVLEQTALDDAHGRVDVTARLRNAEPRATDVELRVNVLDAAGVVVASGVRTITLPPGPVRAETLAVDVPAPHRWHGRRDPYLYRFAIELRRKGELLDSVTERWGFRTYGFDARRGFMLNGEPYALHGVCRHQERQGKGNALSEADHAADMDLVREIGATTVRFAHNQQSNTI